MQIRNKTQNDIVKTKDPNVAKGIDSTILIIGGSSIYTGAPYFTALSSLRCGFDLAYIMTQNSALTPLKILLPEAVVLEISLVEFIINRANIAVIGPGLGRACDSLTERLLSICDKLMQRDIYLIFDGDGIHFFVDNYERLCNYEKTILTPNINEMTKIKNINCLNFVVEKGLTDRIYYQNKVVTVNDAGSTKRCGGQGDILCGIIAFTVLNRKNDDCLVDCLILACRIMRKAAYLSYRKHGESLIASDIIKCIRKAFSLEF